MDRGRVISDYLEGPIFGDLDLKTGRVRPTTFGSMEGVLVGHHPIPEGAPASVREPLVIAVGYFSLAYEQANVGRMDLYAQLTNDAYVKAMLALERALADRLGVNPKTPFDHLIADGRKRGWLTLPPDLEVRGELAWKHLKEMRNDIAHGNEDRPTLGPATATFTGFLIRKVKELYPVVAKE